MMSYMSPPTVSHETQAEAARTVPKLFGSPCGRRARWKRRARSRSSVSRLMRSSRSSARRCMSRHQEMSEVRTAFENGLVMK